MKLVIEDEENNLRVDAEGSNEFCSCIAKTTLYFTGIADWKPQGVEKVPEKIKDTPPDLKEKLDESLLARHRSPNNTSIFLDWIESENIKEFYISDFVSKYPTISIEVAKKIISYQIQQGNIQSTGKTTFKVLDAKTNAI